MKDSRKINSISAKTVKLHVFHKHSWDNFFCL